MTDVDGEPLGGDSITVRRAGQFTGEDDYGNPLPAVPVEFTIAGCSLQPFSGRSMSAETQTPTFDLVSSRWRLYTPYGVDIRSTDQVILGPLVLDIDGDLMFFEPDDYGDGHGECYLKRTEG